MYKVGFIVGGFKIILCKIFGKKGYDSFILLFINVGNFVKSFMF